VRQRPALSHRMPGERKKLIDINLGRTNESPRRKRRRPWSGKNARILNY
jgi:hypothetical protein